jgi:hypothetical protein
MDYGECRSNHRAHCPQVKKAASDSGLSPFGGGGEAAAKLSGFVLLSLGANQDSFAFCSPYPENPARMLFTLMVHGDGGHRAATVIPTGLSKNSGFRNRKRLL